MRGETASEQDERHHHQADDGADDEAEHHGQLVLMLSQVIQPLDRFRRPRFQPVQGKTILRVVVFLAIIATSL